ncbi:protein prenyltransferase alpha subunit repeat-containing protein 1 isoform X2 [Asparagus officinalis]|uniref:protein prenyltransferase alpha subunit repeat-containing protein 1 isoform X2 n=1 Tax=Asparagus officinalis TaxID=4686 RepID=UPI00098E338B|nr:protein prenyltransferase alpha subunit repeat-containing protein 1 isoform X2 [Asparagus officinalis]
MLVRLSPNPYTLLYFDEVGFVHPDQFPALNEGPSSSLSPVCILGQSAADILNKDTVELHVVQYDEKVFWNKDHKLAISILVLPQLYNAALNAYMDANRRYKQSIRSQINKGSFDDANCGCDFDQFLESEVLKHTRALLILSYDFKSAWNSRKLVLSRKQELSLFVDEFQLSALILSYAPKSEGAWSHRQWTVKMIAEKVHDLQELVKKESELVKNIAEKSKMNYRAWNHRCWLVLYMTESQVLDELNMSRKWAELHVADNCCFHYRRRLMLRILSNGDVKEGGEKPFNYNSNVYAVWKELQWNKLLIQRYIGREALWIHRRFLSQCWIKHFANNQKSSSPHIEATGLDDFLGEEFELMNACLNTQTDDELDDYQSQAKHAVSYILWISKQIPSCSEVKLQERLKEAVNFEDLFMKYPERLMLWKKVLV